MEKFTRKAIFFFVLFFSISAYAQGPLEAQKTVIKPRFICDKLYISAVNSSAVQYTLYVFNVASQDVSVVPIDFNNGDFVFNARTCKKGEYAYFIKENDMLIARGSFTKM